MNGRKLTNESKPYLVRTHDMSGEPKTGDRLLELVKDDIKHMKDKFGVQTIAVCTDNGPDGMKMRRLLHEEWLWIIVLVCWAHQINLVVGDLLKLKLPFLTSVSKSLEIVKWFNNHNFALYVFQEEQKITYQGKTWSLILPAITRWTCHYLSSSRLIKVSSALRLVCIRHRPELLICAGKDQKSQDKAAEVLEIVGDAQFWQDLVK